MHGKARDARKKPMTWYWLEDTAFDAAFASLDEEAREVEMERRTPFINEIAARISSIRRANEAEGFLRQSRMEDGDYEEDYSEDLDDESLARVELNQRIQAAKEDAELRTLEEALARLGARMARPYEHWHEEEKLMEYMERER